jgi:quinoprotein glucose dehydrogenase
MRKQLHGRPAGLREVVLAVMLTSLAAADGFAAEPYNPPIAAASNEAAQATAAIGLPAGFRAELVAAEPELANPVAFTFDDRGRILVCETFRTDRGAEDNRRHMNWLDDDLAARSIEDRLAYIRKHAGPDLKAYTAEHDRLRLLVDRDADGRFEGSTIFADGFNDVLDGIGAGVLARNGEVFYTCIPHLWRLRDDNDDGVADDRQPLHRGYGVRFAFYGHDLHGLCWGPDGRLYFSIGDRGLNIPLADGPIVMPDRGGVLRCEPDGSGLEVVHEGLRNPQELAFDDLGNLFTGDNNSDGEDKARFVHVIDGGDSGWRMHYQYLSDRGPWGREKLWQTAFDGSAAYALPPLKHVASGPAGLCFDPGVGLPPQFAGRFFLCDFHGTSAGSGVNAITVAARGAGFEVTGSETFAKHVLASDCEFGPDGDLYLLDFVEGWRGPNKGRIHRIVWTGRTPEEELLQTQTRLLLTTDFAARDTKELLDLLGHGDRRVRLFAQFAIAGQPTPPVDRLAALAVDASQPLQPRIHALWALGQIGRSRSAAAVSAAAAVLDTAASLVPATEREPLAQACRVLGDLRHAAAVPMLIERLRDDSPRVRFYAAQGLGRIGDAAAIEPLVTLLRDDATTHLADFTQCDRTLRQAATVALARCAGYRSRGLPPAAATAGDALKPFLTDASPAVRLAIAVALRRLGSPLLARCLDDTDPGVVLEAARGIYDEPIAAALPALAAVANRFPAVCGTTATTSTATPAATFNADPLWRRVIAANDMLGQQENAAALVGLASRSELPPALRQLIIDCLRGWAQPPVRDRVLGSSRPAEARDAGVAAVEVGTGLAALRAAAGPLGPDVLIAAASLGVPGTGRLIADAAVDRATDAAKRVALIEALRTANTPELSAVMTTLLNDADPQVRAGALRSLATIAPDDFLKVAAAVVAGDAIPELQATLDAVTGMKGDGAIAIVRAAIDRMKQGTLPPEVHLEAIEAAAARQLSTSDLPTSSAAEGSSPDTLGAYRRSLSGGDVASGEAVFLNKTAVSCSRCHKVGSRGGEVGPNLTGIGLARTRETLLESIVEPNAAISPGYGTLTLVLDDGTTVSGVFRGENEQEVELMLADGSRRKIPVAEIEDRAVGLSAMPADIRDKLTPRELRDLVAYLVSLKGDPAASKH